ncbi:MAG: hypothetical protein ABW321_27335 [Polyangiales bacterium]
MKDFDEAEQFLARARRAMSPRGADEARVLAAVEQRIAMLAELGGAQTSEPRASADEAGSAASTSTAGAGATTASSGAAGAAAVGGTSLPGSGLVQNVAAQGPVVAGAGKSVMALGGVLAAPVAKLLVWLTVVGAVGTGVGLYAMHEREAQPAQIDRTHVTQPALTAATAAQSGEWLVPEAQAAEPAAPTAIPETVAPTLPGPNPRVVARERVRRAKSRPTVDAPVPTPVSSLRPELDALRAAERALQARQPVAALQILDAFESTLVGSGKMAEERSAAKTMARCLLLAPAARPDMLQQFAERHPASAYLERVKRSCSPTH